MAYTTQQYKLVLTWIALLSPVVCSLIAIVQFKKLPGAMKIICLLVFGGALTELTARYFTIRFRNNHIVYSVNYLLELILMFLYYYECIPALRKYRVKAPALFLFVAIALFNAFVIEEGIALKLNFAMFSSIIIIGLSFWSLHNIIIRNNDRRLVYNLNFWTASIWMVYSFLSFSFFGCYNIMLNMRNPMVGNILQIVHTSEVILYYLALDIIFILGPMLQRNYER